MHVSYFTAHQLSKRWMLAPKTLEKWRYKGIGPQYIKVGNRVLYPVQDVLAFEQQGLKKTKPLPTMPASAATSAMEASV